MSEKIEKQIFDGKKYSFSDWAGKRGQIIDPIIPPKTVKFKYNSKYGLSDWEGAIDVIFPEFHMTYNEILKRSMYNKIVWLLKSSKGNIYNLDDCQLIEIEI